MFAMVHIPTGFIIAALTVLAVLVLLVILTGAALGTVGAGPTGKRGRAILCGLGAGVAVTLLGGLFLLSPDGYTAGLFSPLVGAGVGFAVARTVARSTPRRVGNHPGK